MLDDSVIIAAADIEQSRFRSLRAARRMSPRMPRNAMHSPSPRS